MRIPTRRRHVDGQGDGHQREEAGSERRPGCVGHEAGRIGRAGIGSGRDPDHRSGAYIQKLSGGVEANITVLGVEVKLAGGAHRPRPGAKFPPVARR